MEIIITGLTSKGLRAIKKNQRDETKYRNVLQHLPEQLQKKVFSKELINYLLKSKSEYTANTHIIRGDFFTTEEHKDNFQLNIERDFYKINKSKINIDFEVKINE